MHQCLGASDANPHHQVSIRTLPSSHYVSNGALRWYSGLWLSVSSWACPSCLIAPLLIWQYATSHILVSFWWQDLLYREMTVSGNHKYWHTIVCVLTGTSSCALHFQRVALLFLCGFDSQLSLSPGLILCSEESICAKWWPGLPYQ